MIPPAGREAESPSRLLAVYGVFVLLVLLYTWPLVLNPSAHLRQFFDVHYFVWVLGWVSQRIVESPRSLFGNIFYPHGLSLAYSEPMLVPAVLTFAPVYAVSRNPILAYNVTVVLFQALAGWAGYYAARQLTGSSLAGWVGGIVFALSPIRIGYYHFAHTQLSFAIPLAFLTFARFLEQQRVRDLAWALFFLWCQMVTVMNFGIPLSLMLAALMAGVLLLTYRLLPHVSADPRYRIGGTGVHSPVDLVVTSAGKEHGWSASIAVNGTEASPNLRGYNVVVVDPRSGGVGARDVFDSLVR